MQKKLGFKHLVTLKIHIHNPQFDLVFKFMLNNYVIKSPLSTIFFISLTYERNE